MASAFIGLAAGRAGYNLIENNIENIAENITYRAAIGGRGNNWAKRLIRGSFRGLQRAGPQVWNRFVSNFRREYMRVPVNERTSLLRDTEMSPMGGSRITGSRVMGAMERGAVRGGTTLRSLCATIGVDAVAFAAVAASPLGVAYVETHGGIAAFTDRVDFANRTTADVPIHPHRHEWWNPFTWGSDSAWANPDDAESVGSNDHTPIQDSPAGGDFSGLVCTFVNPVTSLIIDYKGIPSRKRKFAALERYSPFWKEHNRLTQRSVLAGPSQS